MRKPIQITAPWPAHKEMARRLHISKAREKELEALVDEFVLGLSNREEAPANSIKPEKRRKSASAA